MKQIRHTLIWFAIYAAFVMLWSYIVYGCSATRLHDKAVQKGYVHTIHVDTIKVATVDTFYFEGKPYPVIKYRDSLVYKLETEYVPKWRYKFDNERFGDSLAHIRAMYEDSLRNALKSLKIESAETKHIVKQKEKHQTKRTQSENNNGFADGMKWTAIFAILLFVWWVSWKIHKYIALNDMNNV